MAAAGDAAKEYVAGAAAGVAQVVVGHPFDTVKVKLQAHNTTAHGKVYKNAFHCTSRILLEEGGNYEDGKPHLQVIIPSAACSGALISCILTPTELTKCRMQVQGKDVMHGARYSSPLDCAVKTLESEGLRGIFRGGLATLFRESIGNAVFFCTYEYSRYWMHNYLDSPRFSSSSHFVLAKDIGVGVMSGGISGMAFWTATLPLDVAKTIIQTDPDPHLSRNPFQVLSMVYKRAGVVGCYAGLGPTLARAFPANAAAIVAWEYSAKILGIKRG
nr:unnamed protein product [Digitaria exilis]